MFLFLLALLFSQSASAFEVNSCTVDTSMTLLYGTPDTVLVLDGSGNVVSSAVTTTELDYIQNVTSDVQAQLNQKENLLTFIDSVLQTGGNISLVGDSATPGNTKYYGTNSSGTLGYYGLITGVTVSSPLTISGTTVPNIGCQTASGSQAGCLSSGDWNTFNDKQDALSFGNLTDGGTDGITVGNGSGSVIGSGTSLSQHVADTTHNGYLDSTDWNTFNSKQASGNYLTALTGDGTASGPGSAVFTLATVATPGTYPKVTVNAKGLVTSGTVLSSGDIPNNAANTSGNAGTATALAAIPVACSSNEFAESIAANGNLSCTQVNYNQLAGVLPNPSSSTLGGIQSVVGVSHEWIASISTSGVPALSQPNFSDLSGSLSPSQLPSPTPSTLGGVTSIGPVTHEWVNEISSSGLSSVSQPAFTDISGTASNAQIPNPTLVALGGIEAINGVSHEWIASISTSGVPALSQPAFTDISGTASNAQIPNPTLIALGGIEAINGVSHEWIASISTSGVPALSQPAFTDISGTASSAQIPTPTLIALGGVEAINSVSHEWISSISTSGVPALSQPAFGDISGQASLTSQVTGNLPLANMASIASDTILGNNTGGSATPTALTVSQINTLLGSLSNPMNTLGDTLYGGASGTPTRLAGNTSSTLNVYTQTGTGSASAAPAWLGTTGTAGSVMLSVSPTTTGTLSAAAITASGVITSGGSSKLTGSVYNANGGFYGLIISAGTAASPVTSTMLAGNTNTGGVAANISMLNSFQDNNASWLEFFTTTAGSSTPAPALTLDQNQNGIFAAGVSVAKQLQVLGTADSSAQISVDGTTTLSGVIQNAFEVVMTGTSAATTAINGYKTALTSAASTTTATVRNFFSLVPTLGSSGTITRFVDFEAAGSGSHVATNNAALSDNTSFTSNWFINQSGTDPNTLGGSLAVGAVNSSGNIELSYGNSGGASVFLAQNTSSTQNGTAQLIAENDASSLLRIELAASGGIGSAGMTNGPSGSTVAAQMFTSGAQGLWLGTAGTAAIEIDPSNQDVTVLASTSSSSSNSGALVVTGGAGIGGALNTGSDITSLGGVTTTTGFTYRSITTSTPTTGQTVSFGSTGVMRLNPAGTLATLTIKLPASPSTNIAVYVVSSQTISAVTWQDGGGTAGNVIGGKTTIGASSGGQGFVYITADSKWYALN